MPAPDQWPNEANQQGPLAMVRVRIKLVTAVQGQSGLRAGARALPPRESSRKSDYRFLALLVPTDRTRTWVPDERSIRTVSTLGGVSSPWTQTVRDGAYSFSSSPA